VTFEHPFVTCVENAGLLFYDCNLKVAVSHQSRRRVYVCDESSVALQGQTPCDVADEEMLDYLETLQEQQKENVS